MTSFSFPSNSYFSPLFAILFSFFHPSFGFFRHFLFFTLHHSRQLLDSSLCAHNISMTGCSDSPNSWKIEYIREKKKQAFTLVNVRVCAVDSIKEARRVRVDSRLLIFRIFFFAVFRIERKKALRYLIILYYGGEFFVVFLLFSYVSNYRYLIVSICLVSAR